MVKTTQLARLAALVIAISLLGVSLAPAAQVSAANSDQRTRSSVHLAQVSSEQQGETLQLGNPPPASDGDTLQLGAPPPSKDGDILQLGAPANDGDTLQLGNSPESSTDSAPALQLGAPAAQPAPSAPTLALPDDQSEVSFSVPWVRAEAGWLPASGSRADFSGYLSGALRAIYRPKDLQAWSLQGTVRADSYPQFGRFDDGSTKIDYGESFVRYDGQRTRVTLGALKVLWGRVDEIPPTDQMSVQDISRFTLDEIADRRRAVPAFRAEHSFDKFKLDAVVMPWLRPAEIADEESIWHPVRQEDGRILGIGNQFPLYNAAIRLGTIGKADDFEQSGGAGLRLSHNGTGFDFAATVQRTRRSLPYYQIDPGVRAAVLRGVPLPIAIANGTGPTFREVHPYTWVIGGDVALEALGGTVRVEAAYFSDFPVTTLDARLEKHGAFDWVAGYEFFPGDGNARVTLQVAGHHVFDTPTTLDRTRIFSLTGGVEIPFAQERWIFDTRFALGLNDRDIYVNPKISFVGWEPHEIYLGAHLFSGSQRTASGFFNDNDSIVLGWRAKY